MNTSLLHRATRLGLVIAGLAFASGVGAQTTSPRTTVSIVGDQFFINGRPTYEGRTWQGRKIQGLLLNTRMVQGIFDDRNSNTVARWAYPDTGRWDAERNTREFLAAMPTWREHGLLAFTLNLQGGSPEGYSNQQPWHNSAFEADGSLRSDYLARLERILNRADELGLAVMLGCFYFGQDERLRDEAAVVQAVDNMLAWLEAHPWRHLLLEVNNECNVRYDHAILRPDRVHELITRIQQRVHEGRRFLVGTSYGGGTIPKENVVRASDFILIHGNGVSDPSRLAEMVRRTRQVSGYTPKPILFNEDDHFDFDQPRNNFLAALDEYASWGYFDPGKNNYQDGYQSPPVRWDLNTPRKQAFFHLVSEITGQAPSSPTVGVRPTPPVVNPSNVSAALTNYHGWSNSWVLRNAQAEVIVVPAIGRLMQFGFRGEEGVLWENRALDGQPARWSDQGWINFGGDKSWPSPEGAWTRLTHRGWQPPPAFDGEPYEARLLPDGTLQLVSPIDRFYGIRVERQIRLHLDRPVLTVTTRFTGVSGDPVSVGVWVITQFRDPEMVFTRLPSPSRFPDGYHLLGQGPPPSLKIDGGWLALKREAGDAYKIGLDSDALLWMDAKQACRIDCPRATNATYPDGGSNLEVFTSRDPLRYVELETLGPLQDLSPGQYLEQTNVYTLFHRTRPDPKAEAERLLAR